MCLMKHTFKIVNISKDQDLNLINCFIYEGINLSDLKQDEDDLRLTWDWPETCAGRTDGQSDSLGSLTEPKNGFMDDILATFSLL